MEDKLENLALEREELHQELEKLSLELAELSKQYSDKYNRFNQLLAKWKANKSENTSTQ